MGDRASITNCLTIDLEDWGQAVLGPDLPVTDHVVANTERLLAFLDARKVKATFFALGRVCERFPGLLPAVAAAGHEIATHGYGHQLVYRQRPEAFEADVARSIALIESQIGRKPLGYRAPAFSITHATPWAAASLERLGLRDSSSVFPIRKRRYGIADAPRGPFRWAGTRLWELPMATLALAGRAIPVCGGGYLRLWPHAVHAAAIHQLNRLGHPAVVYVHPYEMAPGEVSRYIAAGWSVSRKRRLMQSLWRSRVAPRLSRLLREFPFGKAADTLAGLARLDHPSPITAPAVELCPLAR